VFYHTELAFPGGFVGVDVFFVVSGFVITRLLLRELVTTGRIVIREFYARRIRRILPVFAVFTLVVLFVSVLVLPFAALDVSSYTGAAASAFAANLELYRDNPGYFAPAAETNPFLHTWTLGVEEQFYLVLPLALAVAWLLASRLEVKRRLTVLVVLVGFGAAVSLLANVLLTNTVEFPGIAIPAKFAFYAPVTRAWEFAAGSLIAFGEPRLTRIPRRAAIAMGVAGGVVLAYAAVRFSDKMDFPGEAALVPVLGAAALIIGGGASRRATLPLQSRVITWIGDISYSWYLWHWPAIVFTLIIWPGNHTAASVAAFGSIALASLSYGVVEQPFRLNRNLIGWKAARLAAVAISVPLVASVFVGFGARGTLGIEFAGPPGFETEWRGAGCGDQEGPVEWPWEDCFFRLPGASLGTILVVGDSHAVTTGHAVVGAGNAAGYEVAVWSWSGCPFQFGPMTLDVAPLQFPVCAEWRDAAVDLAEQLEAAVVVIVNHSEAWTSPPFWWEGDLGATEPVSGLRPANQQEALQIWGEGLKTAANTLLEGSAENIVIIGPVPEYEDFLGPSLTGSPPQLTHEDLGQQRDAVVTVEQAVVAGDPRMIYFDPAPILCPFSPCTPIQDSWWLYSDGDHLNAVGSNLLAPDLQEIFESFQPPDPIG